MNLKLHNTRYISYRKPTIKAKWNEITFAFGIPSENVNIKHLWLRFFSTKTNFFPSFLYIYTNNFFIFMINEVTCVWCRGKLWIWTTPGPMSLRVFIPKLHFHILLMNVFQRFNHRNGLWFCLKLKATEAHGKFSHCTNWSIIRRKAFWSRHNIQRYFTKSLCNTTLQCNDCRNLNLLIELLCNQAYSSIVSINSTQICSCKTFTLIY